MIKEALDEKDKGKPETPKSYKMKPETPYNAFGKHTTMYVSYVKDLVVSGKSLEEAVEIVKTAIKEFS